MCLNPKPWARVRAKDVLLHPWWGPCTRSIRFTHSLEAPGLNP